MDHSLLPDLFRSKWMKSGENTSMTSPEAQNGSMVKTDPCEPKISVNDDDLYTQITQITQRTWWFYMLVLYTQISVNFRWFVNLGNPKHNEDVRKVYKPVKPCFWMNNKHPIQGFTTLMILGTNTSGGNH